MSNILIAGGTGFIGSRLAPVLAQAGHSVSLLSRNSRLPGSYHWDPAAGRLDAKALEWADAMVYLSGTPIGEGRWTASRKRLILESRLSGLRLLAASARPGGRLRTLVSASGIGIYGDGGDRWLDETSPPGRGFLADVCRQWEAAASGIAATGIRTVILRTGLVLDAGGGILPALARPVRWGLGAGIGSGRQYMSWIHIGDLCGIFQKAVEDPAMSGVYNAVAPDPAEQREFMRTLAAALRRPLWLPNVPAAALKMVLGEKAQLVLESQRVSARKITGAGYVFQHDALSDAMQALFP